MKHVCLQVRKKRVPATFTQTLTVYCNNPLPLQEINYDFELINKIVLLYFLASSCGNLPLRKWNREEKSFATIFFVPRCRTNETSWKMILCIHPKFAKITVPVRWQSCWWDQAWKKGAKTLANSQRESFLFPNRKKANKQKEP